MRDTEIIVGIDLGTTNSAVAVLASRGPDAIPGHGEPVIIPVEGAPLLPSVVGLAPDGSLLVGEAARRQQALYPERTVRSVKRRMGEQVRLALGEQQFSPEEVSAMILRKLKAAAEAWLGAPCEGAVITVPAYFSDAQRTATIAAGEIAGLRVERILHEPTAAALCYTTEPGQERLFLVYDLGGGTFDVSIVRARDQVTEVLASHGDTRLGGDDMDALLREHLQRRFEEQAGVSLGGDVRALARLQQAAEEAKIRLSTASFCRVREEHLAEQGGVGLHLDLEITRPRYEDMIEPLIERTQDSVQRALHDAGVLARDLDDVILVGGASRTPLVVEMLREVTGRTPRLDVDPERAVALGAALHAGRLAGLDVHGILVDVTPFSFGTSYFGDLEGALSPDCYAPVIHRNTPVPCRQSKTFYTMVPGQRSVDVHIYQGESSDARDNLLIGRFSVDGLDPRAPVRSSIVFELALDLDGVLEVSVLEKHTGLQKRVTIEDAFRRMDAAGLERARARVATALGVEQAPAVEGAVPGELPGGGEDLAPDPGPGAGQGSLMSRPPPDLPAEHRATWSTAGALLDSAGRMIERLGDPDRGELEEVMARIRAALRDRDWAAVQQGNEELGDILFYLE